MRLEVTFLQPADPMCIPCIPEDNHRQVYTIFCHYTYLQLQIGRRPTKTRSLSIAFSSARDDAVVVRRGTRRYAFLRLCPYTSVEAEWQNLFDTKLTMLRVIGVDKKAIGLYS